MTSNTNTQAPVHMGELRSAREHAQMDDGLLTATQNLHRVAHEGRAALPPDDSEALIVLLGLVQAERSQLGDLLTLERPAVSQSTEKTGDLLRELARAAPSAERVAQEVTTYLADGEGLNALVQEAQDSDAFYMAVNTEIGNILNHAHTNTEQLLALALLSHDHMQIDGIVDDAWRELQDSLTGHIADAYSGELNTDSESEEDADAE